MDIKLTGVSGSMQPDWQSARNNTRLQKTVSKISDDQGSIQKNQREDLQKTIDKMNQMMQPAPTEVRYRLYDKLHTYYVQIINKKTQEVIQEIPEKKFLDMYVMIAERFGLFTDKKI